MYSAGAETRGEFVDQILYDIETGRIDYRKIEDFRMRRQLVDEKEMVR